MGTQIQSKPSGHSRKTLYAADIVGLLGFGLFLGFCFVLYFSNSVAFTSGEDDPQQFLYRAVGLLFFAIGYLVIQFFADTLSRRRLLLRVLVATGLLGLPVPLLYGLGFLIGAIPTPLVFLSWSCSGLCLTLSFWFWAEYSSMLSQNQILLMVALAFFGGGVCYFFALFLPPPALVLFLLACLLVSLILFWLYSKEVALPESISIAETQTLLQLSPFTYFALACDGFVFATVFQFVLANHNIAAKTSIISAAITIAPLLSLIIAFVCKNRFFHFAYARRLVYPIVVACLLLLTLLEDSALKLLFAAVVVSSYFFLDIANWSSLSAMSSRYRLQSLFHFSKGRAPLMVGFALGWTANAVWHIGESELAWAQVPESIGIAILLVILAVAIVVSPPNEDTLIIKEETERLFKSPLLSKDILGGVWKRNCIAIAETHHLTPREREVLFLLAKGRNASIIASDLYISSATAKSHIYHIYQKLNVDSQQELISVVEKSLEALIAQRSSDGTR